MDSRWIIPTMLLLLYAVFLVGVTLSWGRFWAHAIEVAAKKKTLVIINGVTGAIGAACIASFSRERDMTVIGLSRQAMHYSAFMGGDYLTQGSFICSMGDIAEKHDCEAFVSALDSSVYKRIIYVHAVGVYPFEINRLGAFKVLNDDDGDGIDDRVVKLTHDAFFAMVEALSKTGRPLHALIFGGIADKYRLLVHRSWWTVMERVKMRMRKFVAAYQNTWFCLLNISSVICPHEIITRPYVFLKTDAEARFWLQPHEVAKEVVALTSSDQRERFIEKELFHCSSYYHDDYFTEQEFTQRKKRELGILG